MFAILSNKRNSIPPPQGFTLIELLIVTALLSVLFVVALARFTTFGSQLDLNTASQQTLSILQLARNQTLASEDQDTYGVHFETNRYVLFKGVDFASATETKEYDLSKVEIYEINLTPVGSSDVLFARIRGGTINTGNIKIRLIDDPGRTETILINSLGQVSLQESVSPTGARVIDTRHLHLDFGWSMQSSSTMRLVFSDPGNPDIIEDIDIPTYTSAGKFEWEGTVVVYGDEQILRIHTHTLDPSDTILSVHRDRRNNDKALEIRVDGTTIVTFDASGNATPGSINLLTVQ